MNESSGCCRLVLSLLFLLVPKVPSRSSSFEAFLPSGTGLLTFLLGLCSESLHGVNPFVLAEPRPSQASVRDVYGLRARVRVGACVRVWFVFANKRVYVFVCASLFVCRREDGGRRAVLDIMTVQWAWRWASHRATVGGLAPHSPTSCFDPQLRTVCPSQSSLDPNRFSLALCTVCFVGNLLCRDF